MVCVYVNVINNVDLFVGLFFLGFLYNEKKFKIVMKLYLIN